MHCPECNKKTMLDICPACGCNLQEYVDGINHANLYKEGYTDYYEYVKHFPDKKKAIREFARDKNTTKREAAKVISAVFFRYEATREFVQPTIGYSKPKPPKRLIREPLFESDHEIQMQPKKSGTGKKVAKAAGIAAGATAYVGLGVIFELAKGYVKKRR